MTGKVSEDYEFKGDDARKEMPRFSKENRRKVLDFLEDVKPIADNHGINYGQLAISWTFSKYDNVVALCGARNSKQVLDNVKAGDIILSQEEMEKIDNILGKYTFE